MGTKSIFTPLSTAGLSWLASGITGRSEYIVQWRKLSEVEMVRSFNTLACYAGTPQRALHLIEQELSLRRTIKRNR